MEIDNDTTSESPAKKIPFNTTKFDIREKYEKRIGKSLFIRFQKKLPEDEQVLDDLLKSLCSQIIKVRRMRQKSSRCCLVDFNTKEDRDKAMKELRKIEIDEKKLMVKKPRIENKKFLEKIIESAERKIIVKKAKAKLEKEAAKAKKSLTTSVIVHNLPQNVSMSDLQKLFPNAIEILRVPTVFQNGTIKVNVKFASTEDAQNAKNGNFDLNGRKLMISFNIKEKKKENFEKNQVKTVEGNAKVNETETRDENVKNGNIDLNGRKLVMSFDIKKKKKENVKKNKIKTVEGNVKKNEIETKDENDEKNKPETGDENLKKNKPKTGNKNLKKNKIKSVEGNVKKNKIKTQNRDENVKKNKTKIGDQNLKKNKTKTGDENLKKNKIKTGDENLKKNKIKTGDENLKKNKIKTGDENLKKNKIKTGDENLKKNKTKTSNKKESHQQFTKKKAKGLLNHKL